MSGIFPPEADRGGDVAEWLEARTRNLVQVPSLTSSWICLGVFPCSNHRSHFVHIQLVSLPASWEFKGVSVLFVLNIRLTTSPQKLLALNLAVYK